MRFTTLLIATSLCAVANADRLIDIPTARKLPFDTFRLEYADELSKGRTQLSYLDLGIGTSFETSVRTEKFMGGPTLMTADLAFNYLAPFPGIVPGVSFGIKDVSNTTQDGRRVYACTTIRQPLNTINGEVPVDITLGVFYRSHPYLFGGIALPFSKEFRLIGEHNGDRPAGGVEYRPNPSLGLRLLFRGPDTLADLMWTGRF